ncbi:hypothetical protein INQ11_24430, partial [Escherichia coli]|uniref:hypothetical protein n=1 Tax=Escherichia coli TaxID=562 RepID=UPI001931B1B5
KKSNNDKLLDSTHREYKKEKESSHHERISVDEQRYRKKSSSPLTKKAVEEKTKGKLSNCESFSVVEKDKAGFNYKEGMPVERKNRES